jgi:hypothetical protein
MSWDVSVESRSGPMGSADQVRSKITAVLPEVDWSDPSEGFLERGSCSFQFVVLEDDDLDGELDDEEGAEPEPKPESGPKLLDGFLISVRGDGEPLPTLAKLCKAHGWCLADAGSGEEIDLRKPSASGWQEFKTFRDGVARSVGASKPGFFSKLFGKK